MRGYGAEMLWGADRRQYLLLASTDVWNIVPDALKGATPQRECNPLCGSLAALGGTCLSCMELEQAINETSPIYVSSYRCSVDLHRQLRKRVQLQVRRGPQRRIRKKDQRRPRLHYG